MEDQTGVSEKRIRKLLQRYKRKVRRRHGTFDENMSKSQSSPSNTTTEFAVTCYTVADLLRTVAGHNQAAFI